MKRPNLSLYLLLTLMLFSTSSLKADLAISFTGFDQSNFMTVTSGWRFQVGTQDISVTELGSWEAYSGAPTDDLIIGLWDDTGTTLITSATILGGAPPEPLEDGFHWVDIANVTLNANQYYRIGSVIKSDAYVHAAAVTGFTTSSLINYDKGYYDNAGNDYALTFPSEEIPVSFHPASFGANMKVEAIPEPSSVVLMTIGAVIPIIWRRKLRR